ncbi:MAG: hypothetical protein AB7T49_01630 [Oligoflexales bacterium]
MPSTGNISEQLQSVSFVANDFKWLARGNWSEQEHDFAFGICSKRNLQIFNSPSFFKLEDKPHLEHVGMWVLQTQGDDKKNLAVAEAQCVASSYSRTFVFLAPAPGAESSEEQVANFISGIILATGADLVHVVPVSAESGIARTLGNWGLKSKDALTFRNNLQDEMIKIWDIDPHQWWELPVAGKLKKDLQYIAKTLSLAGKKDCGCEEKKKRRRFRWGWTE